MPFPLLPNPEASAIAAHSRFPAEIAAASLPGVELSGQFNGRQRSGNGAAVPDQMFAPVPSPMSRVMDGERHVATSIPSNQSTPTGRAVAVGQSAVTSVDWAGEAPPIRISAAGDDHPVHRRGACHEVSIGGHRRVELIRASEGEGAMRGRRTPHTASTITAISEGIRAVNAVFLADGVIDEQELRAVRVLRIAAGYAARADWDRRASQAWENDGEVNRRLLIELREMDDDFPLEAA